MMKEEYKGYLLEPAARQEKPGKWKVIVEVLRSFCGATRREHFEMTEGGRYILEVEANKEDLNLGKRLIDRNMIVF